MYQLSNEQITELEKFISKLEVSKVRSDVERIYEIVKTENNNIRREQLDQLNDLSTHLPQNLQSFPQVFRHWVVNGERTDQQEENTPEKSKAHLEEGVADLLEGEKTVDKDVADKTVSEFDSVNPNKQSEKLTEEFRREQEQLTKEAQAGDINTAGTPLEEKPKEEKKK